MTRTLAETRNTRATIGLFGIVALLGCSSSSNEPSLDAMGIDAPTEKVVSDATDTTDAIDGPAGAADLGDSVACGDKSCGPNSICIESHGGTDGSAPYFNCDPLPAACASNPTCACLKSVTMNTDASDVLLPPCWLYCAEMGARSFVCDGV